MDGKIANIIRFQSFYSYIAKKIKIEDWNNSSVRHLILMISEYYLKGRPQFSYYGVFVKMKKLIDDIKSRSEFENPYIKDLVDLSVLIFNNPSRIKRITNKFNKFLLNLPDESLIMVSILRKNLKNKRE